MRTYLELRSPDALQRAPEPAGHVRIERVADCPPSFWRYLYAEVGRRYHWVDRLPWTDDQIRSIKFPTLIVNGDQNDILLEHTIRMHRLFPNSRLAILPGGHGEYMGEAMTPNVHDRVVQSFATIVEEFLK